MAAPKKRNLPITEFYIGQVIEYRPPVSGGVIVGIVTRLGKRTNLAFRVTDGTATYPTGSFHTVSTGFVS